MIRRLNSANYQRGLTLLLNSKSDEYKITADDFVGFKVGRVLEAMKGRRGRDEGETRSHIFQILIHHPGAYPEVEGHAIVVGAATENFITVTASHTEGCTVC